jgi:hypothetical protein
MRVRHEGESWENVGTPGEWQKVKDRTKAPPEIVPTLNGLLARKAMKRAEIAPAGRHKLPAGETIDEQRLATFERLVPVHEHARRSSGQVRRTIEDMAAKANITFEAMQRSIRRGRRRRRERQESGQ